MLSPLPPAGEAEEPEDGEGDQLEPGRSIAVRAPEVGVAVCGLIHPGHAYVHRAELGDARERQEDRHCDKPDAQDASDGTRARRRDSGVSGRHALTISVELRGSRRIRSANTSGITNVPTTAAATQDHTASQWQMPTAHCSPARCTWMKRSGRLAGVATTEAAMKVV